MAVIYNVSTCITRDIIVGNKLLLLPVTTKYCI